MSPTIAIVRAVPETFPEALVQGATPTIDLDRARTQHAGYLQALADAGYELDLVTADDAHPDCPFVEDVAVALDQISIVTRPGAVSRRGEVEPVAAALGGHRELRRITAPGTVDGGDVLTIGKRLFIGRSERTNADGIRQFGAFAAEAGYATTPVGVTGVLHLKSAVSRLDDETLLIAPGTVAETIFSDYRIIPKAEDEIHLASTLAMRNGRLLMTDNAPVSSERVTAAGFAVDLIDMSEFQAADGGLTCLSILI